VIKPNILAKDLIVNMILSADDQVIVASTEDELQRVAYTLNNIAIKYHLKISVNKTKAMAVKGKTNVRTKKL
jgi:beta-xylosidase